MDLPPKEFRTLMRDAVFWGVIAAGIFSGLVSALLWIVLRN